jgi:hypothetical protein
VITVGRAIAKDSVFTFSNGKRVGEAIRNLSQSRCAVAAEDSVTLFLIRIEVWGTEIANIAGHRVAFRSHHDETIVRFNVRWAKKEGQVAFSRNAIDVVKDRQIKIKLLVNTRVLGQRK